MNYIQAKLERAHTENFGLKRTESIVCGPDEWRERFKFARELRPQPLESASSMLNTKGEVPKHPLSVNEQTAGDSTSYEDSVPLTDETQSMVSEAVRKRRLLENPEVLMGKPLRTSAGQQPGRLAPPGQRTQPLKNPTWFDFIARCMPCFPTRTQCSLPKRMEDIDWSQKMRIYIGDPGLAVFGRKEGQLQELVDTDWFRDKLIEYANRFWRDQDSQNPSSTMTLEMINYGDIERKADDGTVSLEIQKRPMFIPFEQDIVTMANPQSDDAEQHTCKLSCCRCLPLSNLFRDRASLGMRSRTQLGMNCCSCWPKHVLSGSTESCPLQMRYAPLNLTGDIQLAIGRADTSQDSIGSKGKRKDSEKEKNEKEVVEQFSSSTMFLEVYGAEAFKKAKSFINEVVHAPSGRPKKKNIDPEMHKQLFWYTLKSWDRWNSGDIPRYKKNPIYGDLEYQTNYHHSFFHPKKSSLLGSSHSLLDQFRDRTGNYAVRGAQQKLNILLHGPPGTGKSKFVRTAAMYLQRHVVSFTMTQVQTEAQFMTLLDDLKTISDDHNTNEGYTFSNLLFVVEEIDTDPRGLCLERVEAVPAPTLDSEAEQTHEAPVPSKPPASQKRAAKGRDEENSPPLSLGLILRTLDGGSETPGRVIIMTTNREDKLDEAFKRPGRMKKISMSNLEFPEFKQMILHFRAAEGRVPTMQLWTVAVDRMAKNVMDDFKHLQDCRAGDLDNRGLGLSPALLEEFCMESQSLQQLFGLLAEELRRQWSKAGLESEPKAVPLINDFPWRMNTLRETVLYHLRDYQEHDEFVKRWPESRPLGKEETLLTGEATDVCIEASSLLNDEDKFNEALELCPCDHGLAVPELSYKLQIELALGREDGERYSLDEALDKLHDELDKKWDLALRRNDEQLKKMLGERSHRPKRPKKW